MLQKGAPFCLATDGSNDDDLSTYYLYPIVIRCFNINERQVLTFLLSLQTSSDSTGEGIFKARRLDIESYLMGELCGKGL